MSKFISLLLSSLLVVSPVVYAQQAGAGSAGGTSGAAGASSAAGAAGAAGAAAGVTVGAVAAVAAAAAVVAAVAASKNDPVYTTTNSGTGTTSVCIANC